LKDTSGANPEAKIEAVDAAGRDRREPLFTRAFALLFCFSFVTFFSAFQFFPVMPLRILNLGGTTAQAGWFLGL
jgi:hypothetical protein